MCEFCEVLNINGVNCHELGCPDAWKDRQVECKECGQEFIPEFKGQKTCSQECSDAYNGY